MTKRIITKIGDIFCVEVDNDYKCYFQYVANDMTENHGVGSTDHFSRIIF